MVYSFADFNIDINSNFGGIEKYCADYVTDNKADFSINVSLDDIEYERKVADSDYSDRHLEITAFYRKLAEIIPQKDAFVLHSALFDVDGDGVAFAAHSGTGKTTHMTLWQQLLGDKMKIVNGDKPIIRFVDGIPYGYGTPWNGKERLGCNMRTTVKHICFIERDKENSCEGITQESIVDAIFNQVYMPKEPKSAMATMQLINKFMKSCKLWKIKCNMDISAAKTAYNKIFLNKRS